jgi:plastocyanin
MDEPSRVDCQGRSWMRKGIWLAAAVVVLLSGGIAMSSPAVQAADNRVAMKDQLKYDPAEITIPAGSAIVFHNDGSIQHDAKAEDGSFGTPLLDPGAEKSVTFTKTGDIKFFCSVEGHKSAGMTGVVHVTAAGSTPTTAVTSSTTTTTAAATGATTTTAPGQTTTTTRAGANAAGQSTTTTTAPAAGGATSTTQAPSVTPTSAPEGGGSTATTAAASPEEAEAGHASEGAQKKNEKNNPVGIAFALVSTLLLMGIAGKLLASKP